MGYVIFTLLAAFPARSEPLLGPPGPDGLPAGWEAQQFPKVPAHTSYAAEPGELGTVVRASAAASASGLRLRRRADLSETPRLRWRWKVERLPEGEDPRRKAGDDYAARIYVAFEKPDEELDWLERVKLKLAAKLHGERPPTSALNYIWSGALERGTRLENAYTGRVRMIAVRGKEDPVGEWREEERDLAADYRELFGEPPPPVAGFSLMTDADDTRSEARASYCCLELLPPADR